jgi:cation:H+ antiporter
MDFLYPADWPFYVSVAVFCACALVIGVTGVRLAAKADLLADLTGMGEAVAGAVLLGGATSLSGSVLSITASLNNRPDLAISNALGGIAVQTAFLSVADVVYRRANLEHAAASAANMMQGSLLICQLGILLLAAYSPNVTFFAVHPATPILFATYVYGISLVRSARTQPMWQPEQTEETREDEPDQESGRHSLVRVWGGFGVLAVTMGAAGWLLEHAASNISAQTGLSQATIGALFTSSATSIPELITTIAAVRRGALTLAVGGIIGGNAYDTLFAGFSDIAYREGSIYHAISETLLFWLGVTVLMTGVLLMGLIRREEMGIGRIGFESVAILVLYAAAVVFIIL